MKYTPLKIEDGVKIEAYNTACSQAVTHPSTDAAQCCLTAGIFFYKYRYSVYFTLLESLL